MHVTRITPNLPVADLDAARAFYSDLLGLDHEELGLDWVARYTAPAGPTRRCSSSRTTRPRRRSPR